MKISNGANKAFSPLIVIILIAVLLCLAGGTWYGWVKTKSLSPAVWLKSLGQLQRKIAVVDSDKQCCAECQKFAIDLDNQKTCVKSEKLSEECKAYFEKNPDKERECAKSNLWVSFFEFLGLWQKPGGADNGGLGQWFGITCDKPYVWWRDLEEIERRFNGKTWSGTFSADLHDQERDGYSYDVKISGLHMVFDSSVEPFIKSDQSFKNKKVNIWTPCTDESFLGFMGIKMEGSGTITYSIFKDAIVRGGGGDCGGPGGMVNTSICTLTNNPIVVNIKGRIFFADSGARLALYPLKLGVNEEEILASCGQETSNCDTDELLNKFELKLEGYCDGAFIFGQGFHCAMNKDDCPCGDNWNVNEIVGEGLAEFVSDRDIRLNENESTNIATFFQGDSEKRAYLTGTLYLNE